MRPRRDACPPTAAVGVSSHGRRSPDAATECDGSGSAAPDRPLHRNDVRVSHAAPPDLVILSHKGSFVEPAWPAIVIRVHADDRIARESAWYVQLAPRS